MLTYTAELIGSEALATGDKAENKAAVPSYFGLTKTERETAEAEREYKGPEASQAFEVEMPLIELKKIAGPGALGGKKVNVGEAFQWHLIARNNSGAIAKEAVVVDSLPENWTYVKGTGLRPRAAR